MKIINLTPHDIQIMNEDKEIVKIIPPSGKVARLESEKEIVGTSIFPGILFFKTKYGIPVLLNEFDQTFQFPPQTENKLYIVSGLFRAGCPRSDLWQPGELVRDNEGQPIGCIGLSQ